MTIGHRSNVTNPNAPLYQAFRDLSDAANAYYTRLFANETNHPDNPRLTELAFLANEAADAIGRFLTTLETPAY